MATASGVPCLREGCERAGKTRGLCASHYQIEWRRSREQWRAEAPPRSHERPCSIEGCEALACRRDLCGKHYQRYRVHGDPTYVRPTPPDCRKCGALKCRNASGKLYCKACASRAYREWRAANHAEVTARQRERHSANRERDNARTAAYYRANREKFAVDVAAWQAANRDKVLPAKRKWSQAHPEKGREYAAKRRAIKLAAVCEHGTECVTAELLRSVMGQMCVYCGALAEHADHYIPLTRGGLHCRRNIVPACERCNKSKNNRLPNEWCRYLAARKVS